MALCEQCGSIRIVRAKRKPTDRLVAFFTSKRPFVCRRCGWRARRGWTDADLESLIAYGAGGAEHDAALSVLDDDEGEPRKKENSGTVDDGANAGPKRAPAEVVGVRGRRARRRRRTRARRREIVVTIAVAALVMFMVVATGLAGSCVSS